MKRRFIVIATGLLGIAVIGAGLGLVMHGPPAPALIITSGTLETTTTIIGGQTPADAFPDVRPGIQIIVTDPGGTVIATGQLGFGKVVDAYTIDYPFTVAVPGGLPRYGVEIDQRHGTLYFSAAQMKKGPTLCLGDGCGP